MHFCARGALVADDEMISLGLEPRFRVRQTLAWNQHVAELEAEMLRQGMAFELIEIPAKPTSGAT